MKREVIGTCPICSSELQVVKLHCSHCHTSIEGEFSLSEFQKLSQEDLRFIKIFLKSGGNIKTMERELSISYPTVRRRLSEINTLLGNDPFDEVLIGDDERERILEELKSGKIDAAQAARRLRGRDEK